MYNLSMINSDEHSAGAVCEERAGAAAGAGAARQARGVILSTGHSGKQRGDVKRAGASARTSEHDRASPAQPDNKEKGLIG